MTEQSFNLVRKGYDPAEVSQALAALNSTINSLQGQLAAEQQAGRELSARSATLERQLAEAQQKLEAAPGLDAVNFDHLGARITQMLNLATEEAADRRASAAEDADNLLDETRAQAKDILAQAQQEAEQTRTEAERNAQKLVADATKRAEGIRQDVDSEAAAAREQAAALVESQRAAATAAAIDLEKTLSERRAEALESLEADVALRHQEINEATTQLNNVRAQAQRTEHESRERAEEIVRAAEKRSDEVLRDAESRAAVIRQNAERELNAALARRDSINGQLASVRQLLSAYGGPEAVQLADTIADEGAAAQPATAKD